MACVFLPLVPPKIKYEFLPYVVVDFAQTHTCHLLCVRHYCKNFISINLFNPNNPMWWVTIITLILHLPHVTQPLSGRAGIHFQAFWLQSQTSF